MSVGDTMVPRAKSKPINRQIDVFELTKALTAAAEADAEEKEAYAAEAEADAAEADAVDAVDAADASKAKESKMEEVVLPSGAGGLGISVKGGVDHPFIVSHNKKSANAGIFVVHIYEGGVVADDGRVRLGDRILGVNDRSVEKVKQREFLSILAKATEKPLRLKVKHHKRLEKVLAKRKTSAPTFGVAKDPASFPDSVAAMQMLTDAAFCHFEPMETIVNENVEIGDDDADTSNDAATDDDIHPGAVWHQNDAATHDATDIHPGAVWHQNDANFFEEERQGFFEGDAADRENPPDFLVMEEETLLRNDVAAMFTDASPRINGDVCKTPAGRGAAEILQDARHGGGESVVKRRMNRRHDSKPASRRKTNLTLWLTAGLGVACVAALFYAMNRRVYLPPSAPAKMTARNSDVS